jgi:multiple antibiotic resistance protein
MTEGADMVGNLVTAFMTLLVTINPISNVPIFLALTGGKTSRERIRVALRACIIATVILLFFLAVGQIVMEAIGISLNAFRLAGGVVLLTLGLKMLYGEVGGDGAAPPSGDVSIFPLATPMMAGAGSITAIVVLTDNYKYSVAEQAGTAAMLLLVMGISFACLAGADPIRRLIGDTGTNVISRVMGIVLAALAMQTIVNAVKDILPAGTIP